LRNWIPNRSTLPSSKPSADRTLQRYTQLAGTAVSRVAREDAETSVAIADVAFRNTAYDLRHATIDASL